MTCRGVRTTTEDRKIEQDTMLQNSTEAVLVFPIVQPLEFSELMSTANETVK